MTAHLNIARTIFSGHREPIRLAFDQLKLRVALGLANATPGAAPLNQSFTQWFCPAAAPNFLAVQAAVFQILTAMNIFLNGPTSYTLSISLNTGPRVGAQAYGFVYPDMGRLPQRPGQIYFIYLGAHWQAPLDVPQAATGAIHNRNTLIQVLAHELSHHLGTNSHHVAGGIYNVEHYDAAALALAAANPLYAAHNADNYGYYIEEM